MFVVSSFHCLSLTSSAPHHSPARAGASHDEMLHDLLHAGTETRFKACRQMHREVTERIQKC